MARAHLTLWTEADRAKLAKWASGLPKGTRIEARSPTRSVDQNRLMWSRLGEISAQVDWYGQKLTSEDWKDVFTASLRKARVVPGIDPGTYVPLGMRTSDMSKEEMTALLDLIDAFAAERGVIWRSSQSEPSAALTEKEAYAP